MPTPIERPSRPMAEANERLARLETHLAHVSEQQDRMAQAVSELKESNLRLVAAVEQLLLIQSTVQEVQRESVSQDKRITQLENRISTHNQHWSDQTKVNRKVDQTSFRMNFVWSAIAVLSTAVIGALVRAYMNGAFS